MTGGKALPGFGPVLLGYEALPGFERCSQGLSECAAKDLRSLNIIDMTNYIVLS